MPAACMRERYAKSHFTLDEKCKYKRVTESSANPLQQKRYYV